MIYTSTLISACLGIMVGNFVAGIDIYSNMWLATIIIVLAIRTKGE